MSTPDNIPEFISEEIVISIGDFINFLSNSKVDLLDFVERYPNYKELIIPLIKIADSRFVHQSPGFKLETLKYNELLGTYIQILSLEFEGRSYVFRIHWDPRSKIILDFIFDIDMKRSISIKLLKDNWIEPYEVIESINGNKYILIDKDFAYEYRLHGSNHRFLIYLEVLHTS